jgi:hypothetical protein
MNLSIKPPVKNCLCVYVYSVERCCDYEKKEEENRAESIKEQGEEMK